MEPITTIMGGLLGGIFRLVPEFLKWLDRKEERKHELAMQDKALAMQQLIGTQKIEEKGADFDLKGMDALIEAIKAQAQPTGIKWVDGFNALMRPLITVQWVIVLYPAVIVCMIIMSFMSTSDMVGSIVKAFGADEKAFVAGIANFWFLDRVLKWKR